MNGDGVVLSQREQNASLTKVKSQAMQKYIKALRVLAAWMPYESSPSSIIKTPDLLYKLLTELGFVWDTDSNTRYSNPMKRRAYWRPSQQRQLTPWHKCMMKDKPK